MRIGALRALAIVTVFTTVLAACASDDEGTTPAQGSAVTESPEVTETPEAQDETGGPATVQVAETDLGAILVDADGRTLYLFEADTDDSSTCYDDCAATWPAVIADQPTAGEGVDDSLLGTNERNDGEVQVTYAGHPLYVYSGDSAPGDTNGQGIGDVWYVVDAKGKAVTDAGGGRSGY